MGRRGEGTFFMMLSRIADSMFWLNRYMERVDGISRSIRYFYILGFDANEADQLGYKPLLRCYTNLQEEQQEAMKHQGAAVLHYLIADATNINSLKVLLGKARENARGSQDKITKEVWEQVNAMFHFINSESLAEKLRSNEALKVLDQLEKHCLLYNGIVDSTMPRGLGWQFMNVGKFIERSLQTIELTDAYLKPIDYDLYHPANLVYWRNLLYALSGYELYLKTNRGTLHSQQAISQAIFDANFPRSVIYSLRRMEKYMEELLDHTDHENSSVLTKKSGRLRSMVEYADINQLSPVDLENLLRQLRQQVWEFSAEMSRLFFSYT